MASLPLTDLPEWERLGRASLVKTGPHRTVWRVVLPDGAVYVKYCRLLGLRGWWRQALRPAKARLEFERAREVARRGIATFEPLSWSSVHPWWPSASYLVTRACDAAEPLDRFLTQTLPAMPAAQQVQSRQRVARGLGRFLARMHDAGLTHPDLHPGNLLVEWHDGQPHFRLLDLHAIALGTPLTHAAGLANLVMLNRWFRQRASRTDRLRAWRAYRAARAGGGPAERADADAIETATETSNRRLWHARQARVTGNNRYFQRLRCGGVVGHAVRDLPDATRRQLLADPDGFIAEAVGPLLKDSRSATVAEVRGPHGEAWIIKRFRQPAWHERWFGWLVGTLAEHSFRLGHALLDRGLPTARPLAVVHRRRGLWRGKGYLLCEKLPDARDLHAAIVGQTPAGIRALCEQVARLVCQMHERGLSQRDLKAANVLVSGGTPWLIDLVGVREPKVLTVARRVQNLARLNASFLAQPQVTHSVRLRFLRTYLRANLHGGGDWKMWWHAIATATATKVQRNQRSGRVLA